MEPQYHNDIHPVQSTVIKSSNEKLQAVADVKDKILQDNSEKDSERKSEYENSSDEDTENVKSQSDEYVVLDSASEDDNMLLITHETQQKKLFDSLSGNGDNDFQQNPDFELETEDCKGEEDTGKKSKNPKKQMIPKKTTKKQPFSKFKNLCCGKNDQSTSPAHQMSDKGLLFLAPSLVQASDSAISLALNTSSKNILVEGPDDVIDTTLRPVPDDVHLTPTLHREVHSTPTLHREARNVSIHSENPKSDEEQINYEQKEQQELETKSESNSSRQNDQSFKTNWPTDACQHMEGLEEVSSTQRYPVAPIPRSRTKIKSNQGHPTSDVEVSSTQRYPLPDSKTDQVQGHPSEGQGHKSEGQSQHALQLQESHGEIDEQDIIYAPFETKPDILPMKPPRPSKSKVKGDQRSYFSEQKNSRPRKSKVNNECSDISEQNLVTESTSSDNSVQNVQESSQFVQKQMRRSRRLSLESESSDSICGISLKEKPSPKPRTEKRRKSVLVDCHGRRKSTALDSEEGVSQRIQVETSSGINHTKHVF